MQIAITGQSFAWPVPSLWQGISSDAASITMSDDIACVPATAIPPAAKAASGAHVRLPINRMASARTKAWRNNIGPYSHDGDRVGSPLSSSLLDLMGGTITICVRIAELIRA